MQRMRRNGFTIIELMIGVVLIAILSVIAVPNMLSARISANETSAIDVGTVGTDGYRWATAR